MGNYNNKTKDELLDIISELEMKLEKCSTQESLCEQRVSGRFREQYSQEILDTFPDMITVFDYDMNCVELVSAPHTNHVDSFSNEELCRSRLIDLVPKEAYDIINSNMEKVIREKKTNTAQHSLIHNGELHHYENRICPLGDNYLLCVCRDVTRRVKSEQENRKQQEEIARLNSLMEAILDNTPVYLFVKDAKDDFRYVYWNKEFEKKMGITAEQAVGSTDFEIFQKAEDIKKFRRDDIETMEVGYKEFEEDYRTANGELRVVHTTKKAVISPSGSYLMGISWDITDLKDTQKALIAAREQAEESDRLKSAFLANMSHEICTPLNAIVGFSRLIIDQDLGEEREDYCQIIEKNSDLLLNLFNDIIDLSALEAGALNLTHEEIQLHSLFQKEYNIFCNKTAPGVVLKLDEVDKDLTIISDKIHLKQILTNLLSNAVKFTSSGEIHMGYQQRNDVVQFYVKDSGIGIPANRLSAIFQRFKKINDFAQGAGLGLTISHILVQRMGGHIWARSEVGVGTTFYFTLPICV